MKIQKISHPTNFKSGLNQKIIAESKAIIPSVAEAEILSLSGVNAMFSDFKVNAYCVKKAIEIFNLLNKKIGLSLFKTEAPNIRTYVDENLVFPFTGYGFCVPESRQVLKGELPFETGSIFYYQENFIESLDAKADFDYKNKKTSSSHFLAPIFHEMFHERYLNHILKKYGYNGLCPYTREKYLPKNTDVGGMEKLREMENLSLDANENKIVKNVLGSYSTEDKNQYHEVFAETFTKLVCDTLSKDLVPVKNPLDDLKKYPKDFLQILNKVLKI